MKLSSKNKNQLSSSIPAMKVKVSQSRSVVSDSLRPHGLHSPWNSPGQNAGVGSLSLLQGIFPTQGSNPGLPHYRWILYQLRRKGSPRILEWVAYPSPSPGIKPGSPALQAILNQLSYEESPTPAVSSKNITENKTTSLPVTKSIDNLGIILIKEWVSLTWINFF